MAEWFKAAVLKTVGGNPRRFESCSLRQLAHRNSNIRISRTVCNQRKCAARSGPLSGAPPATASRPREGSGFLRARGGEQGGARIGGHRPADVVALQMIDLLPHQEGHLLAGFDAFRDHAQL